MLGFKIHTGSQMQIIDTPNAIADTTRQGKKYGNLQGDLCFDKWNSKQQQKQNRIKTKEDWSLYYKMKKIKQWKSTYLSQKELFGNIFGYFCTGCNTKFHKGLEKQVTKEWQLMSCNTSHLMSMCKTHGFFWSILPWKEQDFFFYLSQITSQCWSEN